MTAPISPLDDSLSVESLPGGLVRVSVTLPESLVKSYVHFLSSLSDFFHDADRHARISRAQARRVADDAFAREARKRREQYVQAVVKAYDEYEQLGLSRYEIVKRIAAELRAAKHPWCTYEAVQHTLSQAGRVRRAGRPRRQA